MNRRFALQAIMSGTVVALLGACATAPAAPPSAPTAAPKPTTPPAPAPTTAAATSAPAAAPTAQPKPTAPATTAVQPTSAPAASRNPAARCAWAWSATSRPSTATTPRPTSSTPPGASSTGSSATTPSCSRRPQLAESWDLSSDLHADQAQPAQGRAVALRPRVHQRRRQVQHAARARRQAPDPDAAQPEQLVHDHRHARQIHRRAQVGPAAAGHLRLLRVLQPGRQGHDGRPGRQDGVDRHRTVQVRRVGPGRSPDLRAKSELLADRPAVPRRASSRRRGRARPCWSSSSRARSTSPRARRRNDFARYRDDPTYQTIVHPVSGNYFLFGVQPGHPAARQQAGASGAQLRARPQAVRRHVHVRHRRAAVAAVADQLARVRGRPSRTSTRSTWTRPRRC